MRAPPWARKVSCMARQDTDSPRSTETPDLLRVDWHEMPRRLREPEVSTVLRCSRRTVRRYAALGLIRALRPTAGHTLYDRDSIRAFVEGGASTAA